MNGRGNRAKRLTVWIIFWSCHCHCSTTISPVVEAFTSEKQPRRRPRPQILLETKPSEASSSTLLLGLKFREDVLNPESEFHADEDQELFFASRRRSIENNSHVTITPHPRKNGYSFDSLEGSTVVKSNNGVHQANGASKSNNVSKLDAARANGVAQPSIPSVNRVSVQKARVNGEAEEDDADPVVEKKIRKVLSFSSILRPFKRNRVNGEDEEDEAREVFLADPVVEKKIRRKVLNFNSILRPFKRNRVSEPEKMNDETAPEPEEETKQESLSLRSLWRRRHARTLEEGIRREKTTRLSFLLSKAQIEARKERGRRYVERTLMGLIHGLAEEVEDLDVELKTSPSPIWRKEVNQVKINFSRLSFKPIRVGGMKKPKPKQQIENAPDIDHYELSLVKSADEAFDIIDADNSGTLDRGEIASALALVSALETDEKSLDELAAELVELYDLNGDGVVDREEYQRMVDDMARVQQERQEEAEKKAEKEEEDAFSSLRNSVGSTFKSLSQDLTTKATEVKNKAAEVAAATTRAASATLGNKTREEAPVELVKTIGSIVMSDLKLDLRRVVFGGFPIIKHITPGGPLILEPFTTTLKCSFNREDVMGSFLLDAGLRLLVGRALRVRLRSFRDLTDGAYFFGRSWMMTSKSAPLVEVLGLSNVEFDKRDKMVITGRARVRTGPDAPVVTNTFKLRTKIGTGKKGQTIRLVEPELAFVFECPESWDNGIKVICERLKMPVPDKPDPIYSFFPIYSRLKVSDDNAGFNMGEDNRLRQIYIKDGALRLEMRAVLRPGRFLGNHYLAFTLPNRTFIITMDRVKEGIRAARKNKKVADREKKLAAQDTIDDYLVKRVLTRGRKVASAGSNIILARRLFPFRLNRENRPSPKSFFTRFVEGYTLVERDGDAKNERLTNEISNWFGRQGSSSSNNTTSLDDVLFDESDDE